MTDYNAAVTTQLQQLSKYTLFLDWAHEGGIVHPSLQFPAAFGPSGLNGIRALHPISSSKAILFVPYRLCLGVQAANKALFHVFSAFPDVYSDDKYRNEHRLYVFIMCEKLKGAKSFYFPYLNLLDDPVILSDWTDTELAALHDPAIPIKVQQYRNSLSRTWRKLQSSLTAFPQDFPGDLDSLYAVFLWTYKVVQTRSFAWGEPEGMLIPFADFMNHGDVYMSFETCSSEFLEANQSNPITYVDYSDFTNTSSNRPDLLFNRRTWTSRLEKYMRKSGALGVIQGLESVWEVDEQMKSEGSSSDEDYRVQLSSDSEDEYVSVSEEQKEEDYFVVSTSDRHSYQQGEQVVIAYGRHSNLGLLLYYGFALSDYPRDSLLLSIPPSGSRIILSQFRIKARRLNEDVLALFRKEIVAKQAKNGQIREDMKKILGLTPIKTDLELETLEKVSEFYRKLHEERFGEVNEEEDRRKLCKNEGGFKENMAIAYRISQKSILSSQHRFITSLQRIMSSIKEGTWSFSLSGLSPETLKELYPLRNYLRSFKVNQHIWGTTEFS